MLDPLDLSYFYRRLSEHLKEPGYLEQAVVFLEDAVLLKPDGHPERVIYLDYLARIYSRVYDRLGRVEDLQRGISIWREVLSLTPDDDPVKPERLQGTGQAYHLQAERSGVVEDLDRAIYYHEESVKLTPDGHETLPERLSDLGISKHQMYRRLHWPSDLYQAIICLKQAAFLTPDGHEAKHRQLNILSVLYEELFELFERLEDLERAVDYQEKAMLIIHDGHENKPLLLRGLGRTYLTLYQHLRRPKDIYRSIQCQEQAMLLTPKRHLDFPLLLETLGVSYGALFEGMGGLVYLDMAMGYLEQAAALTPDDHSDKISMLRSLGRFHHVRFQIFHRLKDLERAMATLRYAAYLPLGYPSDKLKAARAWAAIAADVNQASELEASARIMELLPQVAWLGVPVNHRYGSLSNVECESIGMSAAAAAIGNRQYDLALEWIEQGRSIVWEQTLQLRAPFDELNSVDPMMAERFKQVSYELSRSPMHDSANQGFSHDSRKVPDAAQRRHRLAETRERLLADIRLQPRLENFLRPKASTLASLVRDGIVVIVNVWYTRCDALVLHAGAESIVHVPLADFSCDKAKLACAQLKRSLQAQDARRLFVSDALSPKDMLKQILSMLWFDVAKPVLDYLAITEILPHDDLPHITWCATGPLSFLPLHAAGDYTSPSTVLPNLAVSSYIPSLGSLRPSASSSSTFSGILTVGQESSIRGLNPLPGAKAELDEIQAQANNLPFTRLDGPSASAEAVLGAMKSHSWVHFACHASQNLGDPMKSALHLYDQNLSLATIANQQLDNAQLAFLSACQTATGDAALPDEAVHLAAGLLFAGYPTVIATMWSIKDQDAPLIARGVYERLLKDGVPDSRKAARALHSAVASLREKVGVNEFARWVPYIHIGR